MRVPGSSIRLIALQLASFGWISFCAAGPLSLPRLQLSAVAVTSPAVATATSSRPKSGSRSPGRHVPMTLDLRTPDIAKASDGLPDGLSRRSIGAETKNASTLAGISMGKPMSPAEVFARRVHQEGLPVARLWETKSAMVSLGLNPKGKPGLWLVQKIH